MKAHEPAGVRGIEPSWTRGVRRAILSFYDTRHRSLPWRDSADPYRVWVSEIMLQQTRVETVIPYYERWIARFPDIHQLAAAPVDDVLHAWAGLGYYSRARNLHRAAALVHERFRGQIPANAAELRALPGIGEYTAGAIASIAFGERVAAVDGNVRRVLARLLDADLTHSETRDAARTLVPARRPGDFNQGLMELGALVCTPRQPRCPHCPVRRWCAAAAAGTQHERPLRLTRAARPEFRYLALVALSPRAVLLARREDGRLQGMWGFPAEPLVGDVIPAARARFRQLLGVRCVPVAIGTLSHAFSHRVEHYHIVRVHLREQRPPTRGEWVLRSELHTRALSAAQRRIARLAAV